MTTQTEMDKKENFLDQLNYLWGQYIDQVKFFTNLIGATLIALVTFVFKDGTFKLSNSYVFWGIIFLLIGFALSLLWRWSSQWAMEYEVLGDATSIYESFKLVNLSNHITGVIPGSAMDSFQNKLFPLMKGYIKIAGLLILLFYISGLYLIIITVL